MNSSKPSSCSNEKENEKWIVVEKMVIMAVVVVYNTNK
jgi:hypothetical protein